MAPRSEPQTSARWVARVELRAIVFEQASERGWVQSEIVAAGRGVASPDAASLGGCGCRVVATAPLSRAPALTLSALLSAWLWKRRRRRGA